MKFIKNYIQFNESNQIDNILDKISKSGIESLTDKERYILDNPDEKEKEFDIDLDGEMVFNGEKISKKDPIKEWTKDSEYDVLEYLHQNFYRIFSDKYVAEDNIGRKLTTEQIINRVQTYFNSDLNEIRELISKWTTGMLSEKKNEIWDKLDEEPLQFGKYVGKTPTEIAKTDLKYLQYLLNNDTIKWRGGLKKSLRTLYEIEKVVKKNK